VVQVDPIEPALKAPGSTLLKLSCYGALSDVAFKFNLRRYNKDDDLAASTSDADDSTGSGSGGGGGKGKDKPGGGLNAGELPRSKKRFWRWPTAGGLLRTSNRPTLNLLILLRASV